MKVQLFWTLLSLVLSRVLGQDHHEEYCEEDPSTWTCDDIFKLLAYHHGQHVPKTLKCLEYDRFLSPKEQKGYDDIDVLKVEVKIRKINALDTDSLELILDMEIELQWQDKRMHWPAACFNDSTLMDFNLDKTVWPSLWIPSLHIDDIIMVQEVEQLQPSLFLHVNQVSVIIEDH